MNKQTLSQFNLKTIKKLDEFCLNVCNFLNKQRLRRSKRAKTYYLFSNQVLTKMATVKM